MCPYSSLSSINIKVLWGLFCFYFICLHLYAKFCTRLWHVAVLAVLTDPDLVSQPRIMITDDYVTVHFRFDILFIIVEFAESGRKVSRGVRWRRDKCRWCKRSLGRSQKYIMVKIRSYPVWERFFSLKDTPGSAHYFLPSPADTKYWLSVRHTPWYKHRLLWPTSIRLCVIISRL